MPRGNDTTERDKAVMLFIERFWAAHGRSPKVREIQTGTKFASLCRVHAALVSLQKQGYIVRDYYDRRKGIRLTKKQMFS